MLVLSLLLALAGHVSAQAVTNATCGAQYSWMKNSYGQSPCLVTSYLAAVCSGGDWFIPSLDGSTGYAAPDSTIVSPCQCNAVFYNLIEACGYCQGGDIDPWTYWIRGCPQSYVSIAFPYTTPSGTQVPTWADIDTTTIGFFSPTLASAYAAGPSAAITPGSTSSSPPTSVNPFTVSVSTSPPQPTPTPVSKSSNNLGPIVGGVIGGVALLALIALGIWFFCFKDRHRPPPAPQHDMRGSMMEVPGAAPGGTYSGQMTPARPFSQATSTNYGSQGEHRLYAPTLQNPSQHPSSPSHHPSSPSSNYDVPPLSNADPVRQSMYPQQFAHQSFSQFTNSSPQSSPPLEPVHNPLLYAAPPGVQRGHSMAPSYKSSPDM